MNGGSLDTEMHMVPLTAEEERFLAWAAQAGDRWAREELIDSGRSWVRMHAFRLGHGGSAFDEAYAAGSEALVRAVDRFDPRRGARLVTFAWPWIARAMQSRGPLTALAAEEHASAPFLDDTVFSSLEPLEETVLRLRLGFATNDREPMSRNAIARELSLTSWRVRALEAKAITRLKETLGRVSDRAP